MRVSALAGGRRETMDTALAESGTCTHPLPAEAPSLEHGHPCLWDYSAA